MRHLLLLATVVMVSALSFNAVANEQPIHGQKQITIGTGGVTGVYYPAGGAICRLVKLGRLEHGLRCSVEPTDGSVANIEAVRKGDIEFGIAQSDWQYHAVKGDAAFADKGPFKEMRAVFSLHSEPFTVVARKDSGIKSFADLKGKRVNIGSPGSGSRATMEELMKKMGWKNSDFKQVTEMNASDQGQALCDNKIDAFVHAAGHPNGNVQEVTMTCDAVLVPVEGKAVDELIKEYPFYSRAIIPGGMYNGNSGDVKSFGVRATLFASTAVDNDTVYQLVKAVFDNFDNFKTLHPVFSTLDKKTMVMEGNTARLHDGARKYYAEVGLLSADAPDPSESKIAKNAEPSKTEKPKASQE